MQCVDARILVGVPTEEADDISYFEDSQLDNEDIAFSQS